MSKKKSEIWTQPQLEEFLQKHDVEVTSMEEKFSDDLVVTKTTFRARRMKESMKTFKEQPMTFVYLSRDFIIDEKSCIMRAPFFSDLVDSYERSIHMGDNLIPYFKDSEGAYCITKWSNINDNHVIMTLKDVERFGRDEQ